MKCKYCIEKEKDWEEGSSEIQCAFENGVFDGNNWNCGAMDYIREIAENHECWNNDQYAGVAPYSGGFLCLEWYKSRGRTDKCIDMETMKPVTFELVNKIIGKKINIK